MAQVYVVTGATGHVGSIVAQRLLSAGHRVRVIARSADRLGELGRRGAEVHAGTLEDAAFLKRVFAGARAGFLLVPPNPAAPDFRAYQQKLIAAIAEALEGSGWTHALTLSSVGAHAEKGNGPIGGLYDLEQRLNGLQKLNVLHLRPTYFLENLLMNIGMIKGQGMMGSAIAPDVSIPMIATKDIGEVASRRLLALDFTGKSVLELFGAGDFTMKEVTRAIGETIGRPDLAYVQFPYDATIQAMVGMGLSQSLAEAYAEMSRAFNEGLLKGTQARSAQTTTPTTLGEFLREVFSPAFRAA